MAIIPEVGMTGGYATEKCSLRVEVISYEEFDSGHKVGVKIMKKLNDNPECEYKEGHEFFVQGKELENLILD